ncbi:MAG: tol-pal system-associated acyl-CoA thioesterase [Alphaproteobacteria bacterium]|nr:tol-pal system-associated acyl-CoA thioesterase [Alphaproteobacteria bacterium]
MHEPPAHLFRTRVYWEDTDAAGIVYYANYLRFAERGRTEMLRSIGVTQASMLAETGVAFAVRRCTCEYIRPARLDDELDVDTRITGARAATIDMRQVIRRGEETLAELGVMVVCMSRHGRPARLPPAVRHALAPFLANTA